MSPTSASQLLHIQVCQRGVEDYDTTFAAMRSFTEKRDAHTPDQLWVVEHPPVYTLGLGADPKHIINPHQIPIVQTDRGGEVTYHGPGQVVVYVLLDLKRRHTLGKLYARELVQKIEEAVIQTLAQYHIQGERILGAPGIYISHGAHKGAKIAALGLKIKGNGMSYHGVSLNVDMDCTPFTWINPCGYTGLKTLDMKTMGSTALLIEVQQSLIAQLQQQLQLQ